MISFMQTLQEQSTQKAEYKNTITARLGAKLVEFKYRIIFFTSI